jgi:hypothetical protein
MTTSEEKLKRLKVDCLYGKKKHFNAADRKENYHYWIGIPLTVITILTTTILFYVLTDGATNWIKYVPLVLAFAASFLSGFQTYFNFNKQVEGHRRVANKYLALLKRADRLQGYIKDKYISPEELIKQLESLATEAEEVNKEAEPFPTSNSDYKKAQTGIQNGEEEYTSGELEL